MILGGLHNNPGQLGFIRFQYAQNHLRIVDKPFSQQTLSAFIDNTKKQIVCMKINSALYTGIGHLLGKMDWLTIQVYIRKLRSWYTLRRAF
jgi:hypothetical protein